MIFPVREAILFYPETKKKEQETRNHWWIIQSTKKKYQVKWQHVLVKCSVNTIFGGQDVSQFISIILDAHFFVFFFNIDKKLEK